jgi:hypothetical protein
LFEELWRLRKGAEVSGTVHATWHAIINAIAGVWVWLETKAPALEALATFTLAGLTWRLAAQTKRLATETVDSVQVAREAIDSEDRRHKDGFMPLIVFEVRETPCSIDQSGPDRHYTTLVARNIGAGLAWQIVRTFSNDPSDFGIEIRVQPTALAVGQEVDLLFRRPEAKVDLGNYVMRYKDVFGREFESRILANPQTWSPSEYRKMFEV